MTKNYYVKINMVVEHYINVKADSSDEAIDVINKALSDVKFIDDDENWNIVNYTIEVIKNA